MSLRFPFESSSKLLSRAPESPTPANATESLSTSKARLCSDGVAANLPPGQGASADVNSGPSYDTFKNRNSFPIFVRLTCLSRGTPWNHGLRRTFHWRKLTHRHGNLQISY